MGNMNMDIKSAVVDIESTPDLLERAMKLSGLITTLFQRHGFPLVVVGGSAVEFYTEGGYMSGDIDFCRKSLKAIPPRLMQDVIAELETPYGTVRVIPPELALVERILIAYYPPSQELLVTARKMMVAALNDSDFNWSEAERLAALPDFEVLEEMKKLRLEVENA